MKPLNIKTIAIKPIRLFPINATISIGKPKIGRGLDRRFATGLGRTLRQQMGDQKRRRWF